jgi:integrase
VLLPPSRSLHRLNPLPPSEPAPPYSAAELISLRSWASSQSTPARRTNASVLLACGVGAGLSASEIGNLRVQNIVIDNAGVKVIVDGRRQREVPVLGEWEEPLRCRVDELAGNRFAFRENHTQFYPNIVSNFVNRSRVVGVRPQTQRMRTTWIIRHLAAGTHVVAFMDAAGVDSLEALTRYVRFVPRLDRREERKQLRNPRPSCPSSMFEL